MYKMYWNFKFRVLQGASVLPFFILILLQIPGTVSLFQPNSMTVSPTDGTYEEGSTITVNCNTSGNPIPTISWYRYNSTNLVTDNISNFVNGTTIQSTMSFTAAVSDHSRSIICVASNNQSTTPVQRTAVFNVKATPSMTFTGPSLYTIDPNINTQATIVHTCVASRGFQSPSLRITFGLLTLTASSNFVVQNADDLTFNVTSILTWKPVLNDNGTYLICNDTVSGVARQILIIVQQVPLMTIASSYSGNYGGSVTLNCSTSSTLAVTGYNWFKDNNILTIDMNKYVISGNGQYLTINSLVNSDVGLYKCNASNAAGSAMSSTTSLNVISTSPTASLPVGYSGDSGQSVTLNCSTTGIPAPSIVWLKDGAALTFTSRHSTSGNSQYLTINSLVGGDAGAYRCNVTNIIGSNISNAATLSVRSNTITSNTNSISASIPASTYAVNIGSSVTLVCNVSGTPPASSVSWAQNIKGSVGSINTANSAKYDGGTVNTPSLTIYDATLADEGNYSCSATNTVGTVTSSDTYLDVVGSIPLVNIQLSLYTVNFGSSVTLVCEVQSSLQVTSVLWEREQNGVYFPINMQTIDSDTNSFKYSGVSISSPSLVIFNVDSSDSGNYVCQATNGAGTGQSSPTALQVLGSTPTVTISQSSYTVSQGNRITLVCSVSSSTSTPLTSVSWQKITNGIVSVIPNNPSKYSGSTTSTPSLTIFNAQQSDAGTYRCTATNAVGTGQSLNTDLSVIGLPVVSVGQSVYTVNYGNPVTLDCSISSPGSSVNQITWRFVSFSGTDTVVDTSSSKYSGSVVGSPSLTIFNTDFADEGSYYCQAVSSIGTGVSNAATLDVIGSLPVVTIDSNRTVVTSGTVTMFCTVSSIPAATSISWQRISGGIITNINTANSAKYFGSTVSNPSLTITNADASDEGFYRCLATNQAGTGQSDTAFLDVTGNLPSVFIGSGSVVVVGGTAVISCSYSGTPSVTSVYWQRNSNSFVTTLDVTGNPGKYSGGTLNTPTLTILNVDDSDEGNYQCFAVNSVGTGESPTTAFLDVFGTVPSVVIGTGSSVTIGDTATISCSVSGSPAVTNIAWQRVNQDSTVTNLNLFDTSKYVGGTTSNPSLSILSVQSSDEGNYRCLATNSVGTSQSGVAFLDVIGNIPVINTASVFYSVNYGSSITLQCTVNSIPTASSVYWERTTNGVTTTIDATSSKYAGSTVQSPSLIIFSADQSDDGTYTCNAINSVGRGTSSPLTLNVISNAPTVQVGSQTYSAVVGDSVQIICSVTSANPPVTSIVWQKTTSVGGTVTLNVFNEPNISGGTTSNPSIFITNVQASDEGTYSCSGVNSVGQGPSASAYLDIQTIPDISIIQSVYNVTIGGEVLLESIVNASPPPNSVSWKRTLSGLISILDVTDPSKYEGGTVTSPSLLIKNISLSDAGVYTFSATNDAGTGSSPDIYLNVIGSLPTVFVPQTNYVAVLTENIELNCNVSSTIPITSVAWKRALGNTYTTLSTLGSSKYFGATIANPSLTITSINEYDEGNYYCMATNAAGTSTSVPVFVDVTGTPPRVTVPNTTYAIVHGESVLLVCQVEEGFPTGFSVSWQQIKNGQSTVIDVAANSAKYDGSTASSPSLRINDATADDSGNYVCTARNSYAPSVGQSISLAVSGNTPAVLSPQTFYSVTKGKSVHLNCNSSTLPGVTSVVWYRTLNGVTTDIAVSGFRKYFGSTAEAPSLLITHADAKDEGTYFCSVNYLEGTSRSRPIYLQVTDRTVRPSVTVPQTSYSIVYAEDVTLNCSASATPPVLTVSWSKSSGGSTTPISVSGSSKYSGGSVSNPSLSISNTDFTDTANYTCKATNNVGSTSGSEIALTVVGDEPVVTIPLTSYSVVYGNNVTLSCSASATPPVQSVAWSRAAGGATSVISVSGSSRYGGGNVTAPSLSIYGTDLGDAGQYACLVTNAVGTVSGTPIALSILGGKPNVTIDQTSYSIVFGESVTLNCEVSAIPQILSVGWTKSSGSSTLAITSSGSTKYGGGTTSVPPLSINNVEFSDLGDYTCSANNAAGTTDGSTISLTILGGRPTVIVPQTTYSVTFAMSVTLNCSASALPALQSVSWTKTSGGNTTTISISGSSKYSGGSISVPSLTISSVDFTDSGSYVCSATNLIDTTDGSPIALNVNGGPPTVTAVPTSYSVVYGDPVTLSCSTSATPAVLAVSWTKLSGSNSETVEVSGSSKYSGSNTAVPSLSISGTNFADSANYVCSATNAVGTTSSGNISLAVTGDVPTVDVGQAAYSVAYGSSILLYCSYTASPAVTAIFWSKESGGVTTNVTTSNRITGPSLNFPHLNITDANFGDGGNYRCHATNPVGTGNSSVANLNIQGGVPQVEIPQSSYPVTYGQSTVLPCSFNATPAATLLYWSRTINSSTENITVSGSSKFAGGSLSVPNLQVNNVNETDNGTYVCHVRNVLGTGQSNSASLNVLGGAPSVSIPSSTYSVDYGSFVVLVCTVDANPAATDVRWQRTSNNVVSNVDLTRTDKYSGGTTSVPNLTIFNADLNDIGTYRCTATNIAGSTTSQPTLLSVVTTPPTVSIPNQTYSVQYASSITIPCDITNANPAVTSVTWTRTTNNVLTTLTGSGYSGGNTSIPALTILSADLQDSGFYRCSATNLGGTRYSNQRYLTVVAYPPSVVITGNVYTQVAGENLTIPCTVSGQPTATTRTWTFTPAGGSATTINSGSRFLIAALPNPSLTIIELRPSEAGLYKCRAINSVGQGEDNTTVVVSGGVPVVNIPQTGYTVLTGENTVLPCSTAANPAVTSSYWTHTTTSGQSSNITGTNAKYNFVSTATNSDLTIKNASAADAGSYVCVASNFIGSQQDSTNLAVTGSAPAIAIPNNVYDVVVGSDITIPCAMTASPALTASNWRITPASGTPAPFTVNTNSSKYTLLSDSSHYNLTVSSATFADAGSYQCNGANLVGTSDDSATLTVSGNVPNVTQSQSSWSVQKQQNITLDCTVSAVPAATSVHWNKTAGGVTTTIDTGSTDKYSGGTLGTPPLTILNARDSDEGNYVCIANNAAGQGTSGSAYLNVTGDFPALTITPSSGYSVLLTQNVTIQCSVISANPAIDRIRWERTPDGGSTPINVTIGGRFSGATLSEPSLIISFAESADQGRYRCIGRNTVGEGSSNSVQLQVTGSAPSAPALSTSAVNVTRGSGTTITCSASGDPAPTITWYNAQGAVVTSTGGTLTLSSVSISDQGTYTCRASNAISTSSSAVNVNVQYSPIDNNSIRTLSAAVPSTITLECKTSSNPPISSYTWSKSGIVISGATSSTLTRQITNTNDLGTYTCTAVNTLGSLSIGFTVSQTSQGGSVGASTVASAGLSSGEIAAIVLAILLLVILIIVLCFCCFSHGVCGMVCGKKESKAAVEPVKEKEVYKEKEVIIPRFHEESIKGVSKKAETYRYREPPAYREESRAGSFKSYPYANGDFRQPSAVSRKDVDVKVNHYREELRAEEEVVKENDYEIVRYESVAPATTTLGTIVSVPDDRQQGRPHHLPKIDYSYEEEERRRRHRRRKKKRRHHKEKHSEDVVVETVRKPNPEYYIQEEVVGEVVRTSSPIRYIEDGGEDVVMQRLIHRQSPSPSRYYNQNLQEPMVVERVIRRSPSPTRVYRPEPEEPMIIETVRRSGPPSRHRRYDDDDVIITERSLSRSPSRRRHEEQYITEGRVVNGEVIHDDSDLRAYNGVVVREPRLSRHGSGRYHVESERRHTSRSRHYDDDDDDGPEVVQGREYIIDK